MAILKIKGAGSKGVIKDLPPFELPPEAWTHSKNVRFAANHIEKIGGYLPVLMDGMPQTPPLAVLTRNNTKDHLYGTGTRVYRISGRQHTDVSKWKLNPLYEPPKKPNPGFDSSKPADDREQIDDPNNPSTMIPNPDYNPEEIPNSLYDPDIPEKVRYDYQASPDSTWYYTSLSNSVIMTTPLDNPQGLPPYKEDFEDLPGWGWPNKDVRPDPNKTFQESPANWKAGRVRGFKNYLIALDMIEGGVSLPQRVRWSNVAYVNELPPDWIEDDINRDGGFNDLTDANGKVIDGAPLRDSFVIYTDQETYLMDYVGGVLIWQFKKLFSDSGVLAPECVAEFEQKHFVIARDDIFVHNGSSRQPVASGRIKQHLISEISSVNPLATKVFAYTPQKEIWITYVGPGQTSKVGEGDPYISWTCNKCAIWNWEWDTWYFMDIPDCYDVNMAPIPDLETKEWIDFGGIGQEDMEDGWNPPPAEDQPDETGWWGGPENDTLVWESTDWWVAGKDFTSRVPFIASPNKCLYTLDIGEQQVTWEELYNSEGHSTGFVERKAPVVAELERTHFDLDEIVESTRLHKFIRHITPQFSGEGDLHCYVGGSSNTTEEPTWDNYQIFNIEEDIKIDAFSNNRYPAVRFVDFDPGKWSFQGYDIDFVVEGTR